MPCLVQDVPHKLHACHWLEPFIAVYISAYIYEKQVCKVKNPFSKTAVRLTFCFAPNRSERDDDKTYLSTSAHLPLTLNISESKEDKCVELKISLLQTKFRCHIYSEETKGFEALNKVV